MSDTVQIMDFSHSIEPIRFKINDDVFEATPELPLGMLQQIVGMRKIFTDVDAIKDDSEGMGKVGGILEGVLKVFDELLFDESAKRFRARVRDKAKPIGIRHMMTILPWLIEKYGLRPTQPSSPSSNGSSDGESGSSSTDGASVSE